MKTLKQHIDEKLVINRKYENPKIKVKDRKELKELITKRSEKCAREHTDYLDLSDIDISEVTELTDLSGFSVFGRVSNPNTRIINVTGWETKQINDMSFLFEYLNSLEEIIGIDDWDVSNVINIHRMFYNCKKLKRYPKWYKDKVNELK